MDRGAIQTGIWLIGIGLLAWTGYWWPGILILIGFSMLINSMLPSKPARPKSAPDAHAVPAEPEPLDDKEIPPALGAPIEPPPTPHSTAALPAECPLCGGPVLDDVENLEWSGYDTARCPYCGTNLPLPETPPSASEA